MTKRGNQEWERKREWQKGISFYHSFWLPHLFIWRQTKR